MHKYIFVACLLLVAIAVVTEAQQPIAGKFLFLPTH